MFSGKTIYNPVGKAGEYARWACNLYLGCSNDCDYCYCKQGVLATVAGGKVAMLKKCFKDETDAFEKFTSELQKTAPQIRKEGGLFFSFTSDPCLPETIDLTMLCVNLAAGMDVPCQILTKCAWWLDDESVMGALRVIKDYVAIGFTLTGMDELERGSTVSSNAERVKAMKVLHDMGIKTFASFEPVVDIAKAATVFSKTEGICDFYKFGLLSGKRDYDRNQLKQLIEFVNLICEENKTPVYWKKSFYGLYGERIQGGMCVDADYDIFKSSRRDY